MTVVLTMLTIQKRNTGLLPTLTLGYFDSSYAQERPADPAPTMMTSVSAYSSRSLKYRLVIARLTCQKNRLGLFPFHIHGMNAVSINEEFLQVNALFVNSIFKLYLVLGNWLKLEAIEGSLRESLVQAVSIGCASDDPAHANNQTLDAVVKVATQGNFLHVYTEWNTPERAKPAGPRRGTGCCSLAGRQASAEAA